MTKKKSDLAFYKCSRTSRDGHLSRTNLFFSGQSIHPLLFQPLYNRYLSTMATSLQQPSLHYGHLSTTSFLVDSPYIHSCFNLSTTATSLQRPPLYNGHLSATATFLQRSFFWRTVHTFTLVSTSPQWPPLYNGDLSTAATSPQRPPLFNSHLSTMATSPLRPPLYNGHFFWQTVHTFTIVSTSLQQPPLYNGHFLLSPRWPLQRGSTVISQVP